MTTTPNPTRQRIIQAAADMLAHEGYDGTTMRKLAEVTDVKQPVIYYYFENKDDLLAEAFRLCQQQIRSALLAWPASDDARELLRQRFDFTWQHAHIIMTMLNYFLGQKRLGDHAGQPAMRIPRQAYRHIQEAIELGMQQGVFVSADPARDASIMVHALNGFAMEHYPKMASAADPHLLRDVYDFFCRALSPHIIVNEER